MSSNKNVNAHVDMLGKTAKDRVTGLTGVVSSISFDLYGCIQAALTPPIDKEGKMPDGRWLDINRLDIVDNKRCMPVPEFAVKPAEHKHGPADKPKPKA